ncbi:MAG TPA: WYL domain-containing protein [Mycobacteriales bacterium]|nr:WYL domain-containing protein [Mycobacteriales bacterium]
MSGATEHLPRLLALVPWLLAHPDTPTAEVAQQFGITEAQLNADLKLIWMCGLPGYTPGDLIEVDWHGDRVTVSNADEIAQPLRLTPEEGVALIVALRALSGVPGIVDTGAVDRALAKIEAATGTPHPVERIAVAPETPASADAVATATDALARGRRMHLRYWVPARDETTERDVDPIRLFTSDGAAYLSGWCHLVGDLRTFRLDRVLEAAVLEEPAEVPEDVRKRALDRDLFTADPTDPVITLSLDPPARWVADYHPCESQTERGDGGLIVTLRSHDLAWATRLALGLAGAAQLVEPPDLAETVRSAARAALAAYDGA